MIFNTAAQWREPTGHRLHVGSGSASRRRGLRYGDPEPPWPPGMLQFHSLLGAANRIDVSVWQIEAEKMGKRRHVSDDQFILQLRDDEAETWRRSLQVTFLFCIKLFLLLFRCR